VKNTIYPTTCGWEAGMNSEICTTGEQKQVMSFWIIGLIGVFLTGMEVYLKFGGKMEQTTKVLILKLKAKTDDMKQLSFRLMGLARECSDLIDEEVRKDGNATEPRGPNTKGVRVCEGDSGKDTGGVPEN